MRAGHRKILFIMAKVPGYREEIIKELSSRGHQIHLLEGCGKPEKNKTELVHRLTRSLVYDLKLISLAERLGKMERVYYGPLVEPLRDEYDYVFDFGGHAQENILKTLRKKLSAEFILYLWDDLRYIPQNTGRLKYFNKIYSFNHHDCSAYGFTYRPAFYVPSFIYGGEKKKINIFYKGTLRERKRSTTIEQINKATISEQNDISLYSKSNYSTNLLKVPNKDFFDKFCNKAYLTLHQLAEKFKISRAILDISYKEQVGLSPRILEAVAANCKIITTNRNIETYDLYSQNVFVLDQSTKNFTRIPEFLATDFKPYPKNILHKYSLPVFIDETLPSL